MIHCYSTNRKESDTTLMVRDYCGSYIYRNDTIERVLTENGYIQNGELYFFVRDYQGNVRVVLDHNNQPVEENSYYPYGGLMAATATEGLQPYKYGGKELDRENGLDLYDSQARWYDPMLARTTTLDPLAEKYYSISPYAWCAANPVKFVDPDGRDIIADVLSQDNIRNSLTKQESDFVMFDECGHLNNQLLSESTSTSENMIALKTLAKSTIVYSFHVMEKDHAGQSFYDNSKNYYRGITEMPDAQEHHSPDDKVYIIVGNVLDKKQQVMTTAHEAYGHALFYERYHNVEIAVHTYGTETKMIWDEELQINVYELDYIPTNLPLENQIKIVVNQAKKNYEERTKR